MGLSVLYDVVEPVPPMVSLWTDGWGWMSEGFAASAPSSGAYQAADAGYFYPLYVPTLCVARRMWWVNGSSVGLNNIETGLYYDEAGKPGAKCITTGSVAAGNASEVQFADITDTTLVPGLYWLYISCSSSAETFFRAALSGSTTNDEMFGFQQSSVAPGSAPNPATPVELASTVIPVFGFTTKAS